MQDSERDRLTVEVCEAVSAISPAGSHLATTAARLREMVGQEAPAGDYMKEAERLLDEFYLHVSATVSSALADEWSEVEAAQRRSVRARAALLAHIQRGAVPVYCTPTEHEGRIVYEHTSKPIPNADGFVLYAAPAPDRFRAAAKMMAVQPACMT